MSKLRYEIINPNEVQIMISGTMSLAEWKMLRDIILDSDLAIPATIKELREELTMLLATLDEKWKNLY